MKQDMKEFMAKVSEDEGLRVKLAPVQPLLLQSKPSNVVSTPFDSHVPGVLSPLLRPAASSLTARP